MEFHFIFSFPNTVTKEQALLQAQPLRMLNNKKGFCPFLGVNKNLTNFNSNFFWRMYFK